MNSSFYNKLQETARELGFDEVGVIPANPDEKSFQQFQDAVRQGFCDGLPYLTENIEKRRSPVSVLPDVQTIVVVATSERNLRESSVSMREALDAAPELASKSPNASTGTILGYATCLDYHDVLRARLKNLARLFLEYFPNASTRVAVDTAPLLEKALAVRAGFGFVGLNTLVVHRKLGTRFFLGELLVSVPFEKVSGFSSFEEYLQARDLQFARSKEIPNCLSCQRCVQACPVDALNGRYSLDARKCLNYWTIENPNNLPSSIVQSLDGRLFGCDVCQRVCPWNREIEITKPLSVAIESIERLNEDDFRKLFKKTPVFRARLTGIQRVARALNDNLNGVQRSDVAKNEHNVLANESNTQMK